MTEHELEMLLRTWQRRLGLSHWHIHLRQGNVERSNSYLDIERVPTYERAVISYQPWLLTGEPPENVMDIPLTDRVVEEKIVHELLHCHTIGMAGVVRDHLDGQLHHDVHSVVTEVFGFEEERCVDRLAAALVRAWPQ